MPEPTRRWGSFVCCEVGVAVLPLPECRTGVKAFAGSLKFQSGAVGTPRIQGLHFVKVLKHWRSFSMLILTVFFSEVIRFFWPNSIWHSRRFVEFPFFLPRGVLWPTFGTFTKCHLLIEGFNIALKVCVVVISCVLLLLNNCQKKGKRLWCLG